MAKAEELGKFYEDLNQEIINKAAIDETEDFRENIFTQIYIDHLCEAAEIEDGNVCYHEGRGVMVTVLPRTRVTLRCLFLFIKTALRFFLCLHLKRLPC